MERVKAVIFDWAGTVIDYGSLAPMGAFVEIFARFGVAISIAEARGPMGLPKRTDWQRTEMPIPDPKDGEVLVKVLDLSLDPGVDDAPAHTQPTTPALPQATKKFSPGTLDEFVADLEASLGNDFIPEPALPVAASIPDHAPKPVVAVPAPEVTAHTEPMTRAAAASVNPAEQSPAPLPSASSASWDKPST